MAPAAATGATGTAPREDERSAGGARRRTKTADNAGKEPAKTSNPKKDFFQPRDTLKGKASGAGSAAAAAAIDPADEGGHTPARTETGAAENADEPANGIEKSSSREGELRGADSYEGSHTGGAATPNADTDADDELSSAEKCDPPGATAGHGDEENTEDEGCRHGEEAHSESDEAESDKSGEVTSRNDGGAPAARE